MIDQEDRKNFIAYVFGHCTGHDHKMAIEDIQIICDQALISMNEPVTTMEDLEVIDNICTTTWYSSHVEGLNREKIRQTHFRVKK